MTQPAKTPTLLWAQRKESILITLAIQDPLNVTLKATESTLHFTCESTSESSQFGFDLNFYAAIDADGIKQHVSGLGVDLVIPKRDIVQPFWPRLTKEAGKCAWIKTDFSKWRDEDDEEEEAGAATAGNPFGEGFDFSSVAGAGEEFENDDDEEEQEQETVPHRHTEHCRH